MERQLIQGNTRLVALLGNPVGHSISPLIHNHAFSKLKLNYGYIPLGFDENELGTVIGSMRACGFQGANVTIPYKSAVLPYCENLSEISQLSGTVNTLYMKDGKLCGTSTDAEGFFTALKKGTHSIDGGNVVILGNGGTSRTLGFALAVLGSVKSVTIAGRSLEKVQALTNEISTKTNFTVNAVTIGSEDFNNCIKKSSLLVNCTPLGMSPNIDVSPVSQDVFHKNMFVFDAIYNPSETKFLREARESGCETMNGLLMLLYQGLASFKYWTGVEVLSTST